MPAVPDSPSVAALHGGTQKQSPVWKPIVMQAKHATPCSYCNLPISPGNAIYPWGDYTGYMHLNCALKEADEQGVELLPPVCKHWSRRGYCLYKDKCFYRHPPDALPAKAIVTNISDHNATTNQAQRISNRGVGRRNLVRNAFRAGVFRRFLIDTFGRELLSSGSGVLDVAGGKGELSFELINLNAIPATVVEPRALQLWRQHKWMLKGFYHRNVNFQSYVDHTHEEFVSGTRACVDPPHLRMVLDEAVVNSLLTTSPDPALQSPAELTQQSVSPYNLQQAHMAAADSAEHDKGEHVQSPAGQPTQDDAGTTAAASAHNDHSMQLQTGVAEQHADNRPGATEAQQTQADLSQSGHKQCASDSFQGSAGPVAQAVTWQAVVQQSMQAAKDTRWTHKGLQHEDGQAWAEAETGAAEPDMAKEELQEATATCHIPDSNEPDDTMGATDISDVSMARDIIQGCSVIVGIHPDQAAEPIINFAQRTRRPFAMVPCCVYPMEFPRRRLPHGTWVRKYEQLIEYLQSRDPERIHVATLPFEGRNKVVYCTSWD